jgi:hypothetical protein
MNGVQRGPQSVRENGSECSFSSEFESSFLPGEWSSSGVSSDDGAPAFDADELLADLRAKYGEAA